MCANFQAKTKGFDFFILNLPKNGFRVGNSENQCRNKNQYPRDTMCANFSAKRATLNFLAQICQKIVIGLKIKINVDIMWANFQSKQTNLNFLALIWGNCPITCNILILIMLRLLQRSWMEVGGAGWMCMKLGGGRCTV